MELKDFKVGQVWRTREGNLETVGKVLDKVAPWPVWTESGAGYTAAGRWNASRPSSYDLVELVQDIDEPPTQTRLDAQLADAMQASRGATAAELALFDAMIVASMKPADDFTDEFIYAVLQLRRKLEQDISQ